MGKRKRRLGNPTQKEIEDVKKALEKYNIPMPADGRIEERLRRHPRQDAEGHAAFWNARARSRGKLPSEE